MSTNCTELWSARSLQWGQSAQRAALVVSTTTATAAINDAISTLGAGVGSSHPQDGRLYIADQSAIGASNEGGPTTWRVSFSYTRKDGGSVSGGAGGSELLDRPTRWRWLPGMSAETIDKDIHGNVIGNSAGVPFEPKATREFPTLILEAYRYYSTFDMAIALRFMGKLNNNIFSISQFGQVRPGQVRCLIIAPTQDFQEVEDGEQPPVEVCHRFEIRNNAVSGVEKDPSFQLRSLDKGRMGWYFDSNKNHLRGDFSTKDGDVYVPVNDDVLLDGGGVPIDTKIRIGTSKESDVKQPAAAPGEFFRRDGGEKIGRDKTSSGAVYRLFDIYPEIDFAPLVASL